MADKSRLIARLVCFSCCSELARTHPRRQNYSADCHYSHAITAEPADTASIVRSCIVIAIHLHSDTQLIFISTTIRSAIQNSEKIGHEEALLWNSRQSTVVSHFEIAASAWPIL